VERVVFNALNATAALRFDIAIRDCHRLQEKPIHLGREALAL
jgi:hypothetical protein